MMCTRFADTANTTVQCILGKAEPAFAERYQILDYYGREWVNFDPPLDRASPQALGFCLPNRIRVGGMEVSA